MISSLRINRLLITRGSNALYDENFHDGVNIIHGSNGGGKSTIADFIFFALGGDLKEWKPSASRAEKTILEISTPAGRITIRREVSDKSGQPMDIFFGPMDSALKSDSELWKSFPYKRTEKGLSFSQVLFRAIGLPEAISDGSSNITMHQIMRLMYVDQLTPVQRIFRVESFDTWQTRQAIGDLLTGVGGYDLFEKHLKLREVSKKYEKADSLYKSLLTVASGYGEKILTEHIETQIGEALRKRASLAQTIENVISLTADDEQLNEIEKNRKEALKNYKSCKKAVIILQDDFETLSYEISDSESFIEHLEKSLRDFDSASETFIALGHLDFEVCPSCFSPVLGKSKGHCQLCDTPRESGDDDSRTLAVKLDLQMQLRESLSLQQDRRSELAEKKSALRVANRSLKKAMASVEVTRSTSTSEKEIEISELSRKVGFLDSELEGLQKRLEIAQKISAASETKEDLNRQLNRLKSQIKSIEKKQDVRKAKAYSLISDEAKSFLEEDLSEHSDFGDIENVSFDFAGDWIAINGEKNRAGSASGMVVLKNSFAAALLSASLQDQSFKLPRWMMFDNIEDKGMVQERSWNFQRLLIKLSDCAKVPHQIIYTTSKIAPELDGSELVVGHKYNHANRSLKSH